MQELTLHDGTRIDTVTGKRVYDSARTIEVPSNSEAQQLVLNARRKLADLPIVPKEMNAVAVVCFYELLGIDSLEIAIATGLTERQVDNIKLSDAYQEVRKNAVDNILQSDSDDVHNLFRQYARKALGNVTELAEGAEEEGVRLSANKDILDRAGFRPADVVDHRIRSEEHLTIEYIDRAPNNSTPTIDITGDD